MKLLPLIIMKLEKKIKTCVQVVTSDKRKNTHFSWVEERFTIKERWENILLEDEKLNFFRI